MRVQTHLLAAVPSSVSSKLDRGRTPIHCDEEHDVCIFAMLKLSYYQDPSR